MSEDRDQDAPIAGSHGFSVEWLRVPPGNATGPFLLGEKQVLIVFHGAADVILNRAEDAVTLRAERQDLVSVPARVWRRIVSVGDEPAEIAVLIAGDA